MLLDKHGQTFSCTSPVKDVRNPRKVHKYERGIRCDVVGCCYRLLRVRPFDVDGFHLCGWECGRSHFHKTAPLWFGSHAEATGVGIEEEQGVRHRLYGLYETFLETLLVCLLL